MGLYAGIAIAATIVLYIAFYVAVVSSAFDDRRGTIAGVIGKRLAGVLLLGIGAMIVAVLLTPFSLADLGLTAAIPARTWLWVGGATVLIVIGCVATAHKPENYDAYPEMRVPRWGVGTIAANSISSALYMVSYEFLFRGFLLFICLAAMPVWLAIAVNVVIYAIVHIPKGPREALGSLPVGIILCLSAIDTGAIWAPFLIHSIMSQMNDYLAIRGNPAMRYAFGSATP